MRHTCFHQKQLYNLSFLDVPTHEKFMNNQCTSPSPPYTSCSTLHRDGQRQWLGWGTFPLKVSCLDSMSMSKWCPPSVCSYSPSLLLADKKWSLFPTTFFSVSLMKVALHYFIGHSLVSPCSSSHLHTESLSMYNYKPHLVSHSLAGLCFICHGHGIHSYLSTHLEWMIIWESWVSNLPILYLRLTTCAYSISTVLKVCQPSLPC